MWRLRRRALSHSQSRCLRRVGRQNHTLKLRTSIHSLVLAHDHDSETPLKRGVSVHR